MPKYLTALLVAGPMFLLAGCNGTNTGAGGGLFASDSAGLNIGKGQYTILLQTSTGPEHLAWVKSYKQVVMKHTGFTDGQLIAMQIDENASALYLDTYETFEDARKQLKKVQEITTPTGTQPFKGALIVPVPGQDIGPDEWNLAKVDRGAYTLLVGKWQNSPDDDFFQRREWAVKHCQRLRKRGYDAYFYHAEAESLVTVGIFGEGAVEMITKGRETRPEVRDPKVAAIQKSDEMLKYMLVNGHKVYERIAQIDPVTRQTVYERVRDPETGQVRLEAPKRPYRSVLVHMPRKDKESNSSDNQDTVFQDLDSGFPQPW
ncbi:MAG: hypothetical protein ACOCZE_03835 [Planctomycetota bacterium]